MSLGSVKINENRNIIHNLEAKERIIQLFQWKYLCGLLKIKV